MPGQERILSSPHHEFSCEDISVVEHDEKYDVVISFSCVDWNNDVQMMLDSCWEAVEEGGYLISAFRLTDKDSVLIESWQYLTDPEDEEEMTNYVVFNLRDLLEEAPYVGRLS